MTTATADPGTDTDLEQLVDIDAVVPCLMRRKTTCPNPAAWLAILTHPDGEKCAPMPTCDECKAGVDRLRGKPGRIVRCLTHGTECALEWRRL